MMRGYVVFAAVVSIVLVIALAVVALALDRTESVSENVLSATPTTPVIEPANSELIQAAQAPETIEQLVQID